MLNDTIRCYFNLSTETMIMVRALLVTVNFTKANNYVGLIISNNGKCLW